jgi:osmotically-inducible protein OsmY
VHDKSSLIRCCWPSRAYSICARRGDNTRQTKINKRDRKTGAVTADQQKESESDREITAGIRKALMDNKELSTYAHNVKIITGNGIVTLKGPVRSQDEKKVVESQAAQIAGADKVKSALSVAPKS